jgi:hypothetical protein
MPVIVVSPSTPSDYNLTTNGLTVNGVTINTYDQTGVRTPIAFHFCAEAATPRRETASFGGLIPVALNAQATLLTLAGITFTASCIPSSEDAAQNMAVVAMTTDEDGTWYSSLNMVGGAAQEINIADGPVTVLSYDAGCDQPGGPFLYGGISFTISKPSGVAVNGVLSCGVAVLGADSVFSGMAVYSGPFVPAPEGVPDE